VHNEKPEQEESRTPIAFSSDPKNSSTVAEPSKLTTCTNAIEFKDVMGPQNRQPIACVDNNIQLRLATEYFKTTNIADRQAVSHLIRTIGKMNWNADWLGVVIRIPQDYRQNFKA
jgi:hypothetical protein